jgi:archaellum component FlaG (FlaF/FlaG flagellin family)
MRSFQVSHLVIFLVVITISSCHPSAISTSVSLTKELENLNVSHWVDSSK